MASGQYIYAITDRAARLPSGQLGLGGAPLAVVPWGELAAVTSDLNLEELRQTPEQLLCHEAVVEAVRQGGRGLPVRFGTVLPDPDAVARALSERYPVLLADLNRLGDKIELGLAVLWDPETLHEGAQPPALSPQPSEGAGTRYLGIRLAEHRQETFRRSRAMAYAQAIDEVLRRPALDRCCAVLPTPRLLLRAAYLLGPAGDGPFRSALEGIRRAWPGFRFLVSGPWPPYSFVTPPDAAPTAAFHTSAESMLVAAARQRSPVAGEIGGEEGAQ